MERGAVAGPVRRLRAGGAQRQRREEQPAAGPGEGGGAEAGGKRRRRALPEGRGALLLLLYALALRGLVQLSLSRLLYVSGPAPFSAPRARYGAEAEQQIGAGAGSSAAEHQIRLGAGSCNQSSRGGHREQKTEQQIGAGSSGGGGSDSDWSSRLGLELKAEQHMG